MFSFSSLEDEKISSNGRLLKRHHKVYKENQEEIRRLEKEGKAMVIAPSAPLKIDRFEKSRERLLAVYHQGFADGEKFIKNFKY